MTMKSILVPMLALILLGFLFISLLGADTIDQKRTILKTNSYKVNPSITLNEEQKIAPIDSHDVDQFGESVAISGDYTIIGAFGKDDNGYNSGAAYIFHNDNGTWKQQAKLTASDNAEGDSFGYSVSISGDYAIVGAYMDDDNGSASGSAYIFHRDGTTWTQQSKLTASDGEFADWFGYSVSIFGNFTIVGAMGDDDNGGSSGSAYIFSRSGDTWNQIVKLTASDGDELDRFGYSVSIHSEYVIVGAPDDYTGNGLGSAYLFQKSGSTWIQGAKLTANDGAAFDYFGQSVSVSSEFAVVGAPWNDDSAINSGAVYVFQQKGTTWSQCAKLLPEGESSNDLFGSSVSLKGDYALIGASRDDNQGSSYIFRRNHGIWIQQYKLTARDGFHHDGIGTGVSLSDKKALIGAPGNDDHGFISGAAYIFQVLPLRGDIKVNINSADAVVDGAMWRLSFQEGWRKSGTIAHGVEPGTYTIRYKPVEGWIKPADEEILVESDERTLITGTYIKKSEQPDYGFLKVVLKPTSARNNNARWKILGSDTWRKSHEKIKLPVGTARIKCNRIKGCKRPTTHTPEIQAGKLTVVEIEYHEK